ncbi:MAG TPA: conjugal transfer protein TraG N-terminal domain-containing protein, partial [Candidatus Hydrogenedentes bacterium]|nr:conjugal transfer protein TraG N-terminal domain-containing protein [Candidatus Hydrogenedentota bacterium]
MGTYEIFTYGSGNFIAQIFTGIALIFSGTAITDLVKIVLLVGLLVAVLNPVTSWLTKGQAPTFSGGEGIIAMLKQVLLAAIVMYALILPRANVAIIDRIDPNQNTIVGNVPMVQAFVAYGASQIGDKIGKEMETAFSLPDSMTFRNGGLGLGIKYIDTVFTIQPPGADVFNGGVSSNGSLIRQSLDDYFTECVFPNFTSTEGGTGDRTRALNALANSTNILETLALFHGIYDSTREITGANDTGKATCTSALADIRTAWGEIYPEWVKEIETKVSNGTSTNPDTLGTGIMTSEIISRYFPGSMSTQDKLINIAVVNAMRKATLTYEARFGDTNKTALELSTSSAVASWQTTARMFGAIVHTMRNVFEGLIYGLACLLPVAVAVVGLSALATYFKVVLWLQLWVPFYVLLNLFGDMEMTRALQSLSLQTDNPTSGISIKMYNDVVEKAQLSLGYLGSLSFTVPMFAWGLLKGGEYAMSSAVSAMTSGGGAAAQASSIGGQVGGLGNVSVGQKSFDSHSFRQSSAASSSFNYDNQVQGAMQRGTEISGLTGLTPMQQGKIASFTNTMSSIGQFNGAGGYSSFAVMSGLNGAMAAGTTFGNEQMANKAFKNDPDAMFKLGDAIAKTGATGKTATGIENITRETGATSDEAVNRLTAAGGRESAQSFFYNEAYYDKLMGGKGLSLSNLGEIQSRDPVAKMNTDRQISQAEHDMSALTNKQREVYTNWGIRTALENYNGNIESFYNRLGYFNTAESTGKMNAVQNYVDKHGMSYVDFFTGMNSHGQYFNRNIAWNNSGSELYSKGMSGRS